jgi:hypothetical protein
MKRVGGGANSNYSKHRGLVSFRVADPEPDPYEAALILEARSGRGKSLIRIRIGIKIQEL